MLSMLPLGLSNGLIVTPAFALMAVFYWALYRPDLMPPSGVFLIGLYHDLLSAGPLGLWTFVYLVSYGLILSQRLFFIGKAFFAIWFGFGAIAVLSGLVAWVVGSLFYWTPLSPVPALAQAVLSFFLYPIFARIFSTIQRRFLSQS
jgi:rod shape-determining protein MreD